MAERSSRERAVASPIAVPMTRASANPITARVRVRPSASQNDGSEARRTSSPRTVNGPGSR